MGRGDDMQWSGLGNRGFQMVLQGGGRMGGRPFRNGASNEDARVNNMS